MKSFAEVKYSGGLPRLLVDGIEVPPVLYGLSDIPGSRCRTAQAQRNIANFGKAGINIVQCDWNLRDGWTEDNRFDPTLFFKDIEAVTRPGSDTRLMVRLHMNPPLWWIEEHPEELTVFGIEAPPAGDHYERLIHNDNNNARRVSLASDVWCRDAGKVLADFCHQMDDTEPGGFIIGIQPASGMFGEWHNWGGRFDPDHGPAQTRLFRRYLRDKYADESALKEAWHDPDAAFDTATIPTTEERRSTCLEVFRDPAREQRVIDSLYAQMLAPAEAIIYFSRIIKESSSRLVAGTFFTYFFAASGPISGHLAADTVLKSPYVDYVSAPAVYGLTRDPGSSSVSRSALESCRLNGKLFLTEMDQPPEGAVATAPGGDPARDGLTINLMRRNVMEPFLRGMGLWYYDHRLKSAGFYEKHGWWDTPVLMKEIAGQFAVCKKYFNRPYTPTAEILCVWSLDTFYYTTIPRQTIANISIIARFFNENVSRCGAPHDHIFFSDLPQVDVSRYKVIIFPASQMLTPQQRELIKEKVLSAGKQVIFLYNPGFCDGKNVSADNCTTLTGIKFTRCTPAATCNIDGEKIDINGSVLMENPGGQFSPMLRPDDPDAENIAFFDDGTSAGCRKTYGNSTVWYLSIPYIPAKFLRKILKACGAHLYSNRDLIVKAGRGLLLLHAPADGNYTITLKNGKQLDMSLKLADSILLDADSGEKLL